MHTAGAAAAAIAQAIKASGAIVRMEPNHFLQIVYRAEDPLVVMSMRKTFGKTSYKYITSHKGLAFFTKSGTPLQLGNVELVTAKSIWMPS